MMLSVKYPQSNAKSTSRVVLTCHRLVSQDKNQGEIRKKAILRASKFIPF